MKKGLLYTIIAYVGIILLVGIYWLNGGSIKSSSYTVIAGACMFLPLVATIITQLVHKEPVLKGIGIKWKVNRWWFVAWLLPPVLVGVMICIVCLLPGYDFSLDNTFMNQQMENLDSFGLDISPQTIYRTTLFSTFINALIFPTLLAFGEETGWRGYLLKQFSSKKFLFAAIVIGAIWGLWHAPLILMGHNFPDNPISGVFMMIAAGVFLAPLVQFIRVKSGSVIAAAIFHGSFNSFSAFLPLSLNQYYDLLTSPVGLIGIVVFIFALLILHLTDRKVLSSTINIE